MIRHKVMINGIEIEAVYSEQTVKGIFLPLLKKLTEMQKGKRTLVMLAAPPGAGKSTLLSSLSRLSREEADPDHWNGWFPQETGISSEPFHPT